MSETVVNVYEAKTSLSKLLERVEKGDEIVLGRAGRRRLRLWRNPDSRLGLDTCKKELALFAADGGQVAFLRRGLRASARSRKRSNIASRSSPSAMFQP